MNACYLNLPDTFTDYHMGQRMSIDARAFDRDAEQVTATQNVDVYAASSSSILL